MILPMVVAVFGAACGRESATRADQKNYEVVQEGSANGVTSTIQGPGETLPMTGTNADTTTAFTIDPTSVGSMPPPGTVVGTLPSPAAYPDPAYTPPGSTAPRSEPSRTQSRPVDPAPQSAPRPDPSEMRQDPRPAEPAMTETATAPPKAPETVEPQQDQDEPVEEEEVPPPTSTDTRGQ